MFTDWKNQNAKYLGQVKGLLSAELPDMEEPLISHLRSIEMHYARVGCLLAEANSFLDNDINTFYEQIKAETLTVPERKAKCDAYVSGVRETRDKIKALLESIELRVNLGQSLLKQQRGERRMAGNQ